MTKQRETRLSTDDFITWAQQQSGRWELHQGEPVAISPERVGHANAKFAVQAALKDAIRKAGAPCHMLPDGMTVRIDATNAYEPDALVTCGKALPDDVVEIPNPVIVVEVLSPGTKRYDTGAKFSGYLSVPSLRHYLIVDASKRLVIHHRRGDGGAIESGILHKGALKLEPPGIEVRVEALFAGG
jgi:Uma2 family endonuclease